MVLVMFLGLGLRSSRILFSPSQLMDCPIDLRIGFQHFMIMLVLVPSLCGPFPPPDLAGFLQLGVHSSCDC